MNTPIPQNNNSSSYKILVISLNILTSIFVIAGIIIPAMMIVDLGSYISRSPEILIIPIYLLIVLFSLAGMSYIIAEILKQPSSETVWLENTMTYFGVILIIVGVIAFFIAATNDSSISELRKLGVEGGFLLLIVHLKIGLLCLGLASIHNKLNSTWVRDDKSNGNSSRMVYCTSCGKQVEIEPGDKMCYHCGGQL